MTTQTVTVSQVLQHAASGEWNLPEFQREFVWKASQVAELAESLRIDEAVGAFYLWVPSDPSEAEPRLPIDGLPDPEGFVLDGQQRATAFCLLFGVKPAWLTDSEWRQLRDKRQVVYNVRTGQFSPAKSSLRTKDGWVSAPDVFATSDGRRMKVLRQIAGDDDDRIDELYSNVSAVRDKLTSAAVPVFRKVRTLEAAYRAFQKLNNNGTNVTQDQLQLAFATTVHRGFSRDEFSPFVAVLEGRRFAVGRKTVLRSLTGVWVQKTRLSEVRPGHYREDLDGFEAAWKRTQRGWERVIRYFDDYGIRSSAILPATSPLMPLVYLAVRFPQAFETGLPLKWLLLTSRLHRYDSASPRWVDEDLAAIHKADTWKAAIRGLLANLGDAPFAPYTPDELKKLQVSNAGGNLPKLLYYLAVYNRGAEDWKTGGRLVWTGQPRKLMADLDTDWHHVFPVKLLRSQGFADELIGSIANISLICHLTNLELSDTSPSVYLIGMDQARLDQQAIPSAADIGAHGFGHYLDQRAYALSTMFAEFIEGLGAGVEL